MGLTHIDADGNAIMVDVSDKTPTHRTATAIGKITMNNEAFRSLTEGTAKKGDVLAVARVAGIMALKRTSELIPLCHTLNITKSAVNFTLNAEKCEVTVTCTVSCDGKTGVEMEALTGTSVTLLTIYDMLKAVDKRMVMGDIHLVEKHGGKSGDFFFEEERNA